MDSRRKPANEILTGQVDGLNHDGWGVTRRDGKAVFVAGALPGETIEYRVRRRQRNFDEAELVRVIEPAADRIVPGCAHFGTCGGCALQHLAPHSQLQIKDAMLREALRRIGKVEPAQWLAPLSAEPWGYRRRARLGARFVHSRDRSMVGFRERMSSFVADIERCPVLVPQVGNLVGQLSTLISRLSIPTRIPQIEVAAGDDCVVLVLRILSPLTDADRAALLEFEQRHQVRWLLQPGGPATLEPLQGAIPQLWYGLPAYGLRMAFEPADFIQVNGAMNQRLISHVLELLRLDAGSEVVDLFCGLGNFTLPMATRVHRVLGMEADAGLIARAQANAVANGLSNAQFVAVNLAGEDAGQRCLAAAAKGPWSHVLLDPPRTGAMDILPAIAKLAPRRVVYVSCHPGSLARDLGILITEHGFTLAAAGIVDMFPHTSHVESVAVLDGPGCAQVPVV
ncbi:MAG: 23S rRNA (uracil(1939)-C(5))-methyltransferase RlmD [Pseudomonadota bacterium]